MEQDVTIMEKERRLPNRHIPENLDQFLNTSQVLTLHQIESFGWHIQFVRHPLFQDPVIFIGDVKSQVVGVLQEDGTIANEQMPIMRR